MCGIVGFVDLAGGVRSESLTETVSRMRDALQHRGPDDCDVWVDDRLGIAFGHRRLAVVDVSQEGRQPMLSPSGRYRITFNGEIYNHRDLREELTQGGCRFRGHSDTEVLLAAVERFGLAGAVERSVGMFAFALWDAEARTLHLGRDRLGEKPLYYGYAGDAFLFASELKALTRHPGWIGEISRDVLTLYLRYNYVPAPWSIYQGIYKLASGCLLTLPYEALRARSAVDPFPGSPTSQALSPASFWSVEGTYAHGRVEPFTADAQAATDQLESLLRASIGDQMIADVPLGALLSGGIDSTTVVALMQRISRIPVRTFSIGFDERAYNEAPHAKSIAAHLGTDHTELYVTPGDALGVVPSLPAIYDEPFADSSQIPTFLVSKLAREQVTVALSGDGGDELFGGYERYLRGRTLWRGIHWMPGAMRAGIGRGLTAVTPQQWDSALGKLEAVIPKRFRLPNMGDKLHKVAKVLDFQSQQQLYRHIVSYWREPETLVREGSEPATLLAAAMEDTTQSDLLRRMMYWDTISYLPDDILAKVDRASMRVSLEVRVPFLDHRVVEFAARLPTTMKVRGSQGKWLLRRVLYRHVPRELIDRPKMGFGVPIETWLRGPLKSWAEDLLAEDRLRADGYLDPQPIRQRWQEHLGGTRNWQYHLWGILMFQAWLDANR